MEVEEDAGHDQGTLHAPVTATPDAYFWREGLSPDDLYGKVHIPPAPAALSIRLGKCLFWRAEKLLSGVVKPPYKKASVCGL